ncbi:MAG TPA: UvrD-helicase domain-containing protein, partial [Dehalococcoidia bacterium]
MEAFVPADQATREEIRTNLDVSLCVEAGAGTGKTTVLVDRIVELVRRGRAGVDELAVITFTEKAAAELAARVRRALEEAAATDGEERRRLAEARRNLHRARIETIHAFAAGLLREHPVEAALDPHFEILEGPAETLAFDEAFRSWLARALAEAPLPLRRALNRGLDLAKVRQAAQELHRFRDLLPLEPFPPVQPDVDGFLASLEASAAELTALLQECTEPEDAAAGHARAVAALLADCLARRTDAEALERILLAARLRRGRIGNRNNWSTPASLEQARAIFERLHEDLTQLQADLRTEALTGLLPLLEDFVREYEARRRAEGRAEFQDLLIWARNLVRDRPDVRQAFRDRFRCVLVDEFQDTDPLQAELVLYLTSADEAADWQELRPEPGRLFVVGDPKQSIYRFRRADVAVYQRMRRGALRDGLRHIVQNFRSVPGVIAWINHAFRQLMQEEDGVQAAYVALAAPPLEPPPGRSPVVVLCGEEHGKADDLRRYEAACIAGLIRRAVEEERWQVYDPDARRFRDATYRDVAVLVRSRTAIERYEEALAAAGVPYRHESGRDFYRRQEVLDLIACLRAVDDPTDRLSLVAALRSYAFGCSDQELFQFVADGGRLDYRQPPPEGHPAVAEALATLARLHQERRRLPLAALVRRTLAETRLVALALTLPQGERAAANLLKVVDQARAFARARGGGLRAFTRWLASVTEAHAEESDAAAAEAGDNVVRLLTIHAAKGLEFPIVILANLNSARTSGPTVVPDREGRRLHLQLGSRNAGFQTPGFDVAAELEVRHQEAEDRRLLYVAATRARDHLVIPVTCGRAGAAGLLGCLAEVLPAWSPETLGTDVDGCHLYDAARLAPDLPARPARTPVPSPAVAAAEAAYRRWRGERERLLAAAGRGLRVATASSAEAWDRPLADDEGSPAAVERRGAAAAIGTALHETLRWVDLPDARNLDAVARQQAAAAGAPDRADEVAALARACLASPAVQRALRSSALHREVVYSLGLPDGGLVEGRMDLL